MAKFVLTGAMLLINAVDVSASTKKASIKIETDKKETTTFGSSGWKEIIAGIKSASISAEFYQDVAAAALDSIMWPLLGTVVTFEIRMANGARSASNPAYTGSILISEWSPIDGSVGDDATVSVGYDCTGAVTRVIS